MLGPAPLIDPTARVERCALGRYTEVGARTSLIETALGDYSYVVNDADIIYSRIGKFCSIAAHTRINPGDHPMWPRLAEPFHLSRQRLLRGRGGRGRVLRLAPVAPRYHRPRRVDRPWRHRAGRPDRRHRRRDRGRSGRDQGRAALRHRGGRAGQARAERFEPAIARRIEALAWWDWDHDKLRAALPDFRTLSPEAFLDKHGA